MLVVLFLCHLFSNQLSAVEEKMSFIEGQDLRQKWVKSAASDEKRVLNLIHYLKRSKTGSILLAQAAKKAARHGETLTDMILPGEVSITDTTLIRRFNRDNPLEMVYETKSKVFINVDLSFQDAILDLAHELTHYNYKDAFNPYQQNFSAPDFLKSTLEGKGGEVEAYLVECKVMAEIFPSSVSRLSHCHKIRDAERKTFSKEKAKNLFYQLGNFYDVFQQELKEAGIEQNSISTYSKGDALFISSAYGLPYPLASLREYQGIMTRVCENDRKRLGLLRDSIGRTLASVQKSGNEKLYQKINENFQNRCPAFIKTP